MSFQIRKKKGYFAVKFHYVTHVTSFLLWGPQCLNLPCSFLVECLSFVGCWFLFAFLTPSPDKAIGTFFFHFLPFSLYFFSHCMWSPGWGCCLFGGSDSCMVLLYTSHWSALPKSFTGTAQLLYLLLHWKCNPIVCMNWTECYLENTAQARSLG